MKAYQYAYFLLPLLLWPLTFIVFRSMFVYAMLLSTFALAAFTIYKYKGYIRWKGGSYLQTILAGIIFAVALYLIFYFGYFASSAMGLKGSVANVYAMLYSQSNRLLLVVSLAFIGLFEEIYWRGGVQGFASKTKRFSAFPWVISTAYYTAVHLSTLNPILVVAAFVVGLSTSLIANRYGIISSAISHIIWIEAVVVFLPILPA
ncbi:MAG: CPBP family intramembrane metalloprotease [Candidatus Micrarchaeota archaeon]|nr:CPBP family intramembrane metalloprotease [Candidatus Micrarchaeota archaeon]